MAVGHTKENGRASSTTKCISNGDLAGEMPGQEESQMTPWQLFRKWPRLTLWSLCLAITIILYGYDTVIVGNVTSMPEFQ